MTKYTEYQKNEMASYKMNKKGPKVFRPCLGLYCRGKKFWSYGGARICPTCKIAIEGMENDEPQIIRFR